ncbi:MAG: hypothetical protein QW756_05695 [Nitrososphaerota archaeon]
MKLIHIISASLWIGGILFTVLVNRRLREAFPPVEAIKLLGTVGRAIQRPMRYSLYLAVITGLLILSARGVGIQSILNPSFYATYFGTILMIKTVIVMAILIILPLHSRLGTELSKMENGPGYARKRLKTIVVGWASLSLTIAVMMLGTLLRFS